MNNNELEKKAKQVTSELAYQKGYVCSVDVLIKLGYITEDFGQKQILIGAETQHPLIAGPSTCLGPTFCKEENFVCIDSAHGSN